MSDNFPYMQRLSLLFQKVYNTEIVVLWTDRNSDLLIINGISDKPFYKKIRITTNNNINKSNIVKIVNKAIQKDLDLIVEEISEDSVKIIIAIDINKNKNLSYLIKFFIDFIINTNNFINKNSDFNKDLLLDSKSLEFKKLLEIAHRVALSDSTILITGETGTGKEILADYIHKYSSRKSNKLISINCGALPENLLENELFGHIKGAYTGADSNYAGKIATANKSTLFLDEIGEMPLSIQSKILRLIETGTYEALGSNETQKTEIRLIAATNKDLYQMTKSGLFRPDLYYRLNVIPLKTIALRDRKEDIETLAIFFLKMYNAKYGKEIIGFEDRVIDLLIEYDWPGNIRELKNLIERAVITGDDNKLNEAIFNGLDIKDRVTGSLKNAIDSFKKEYIIKALRNNNWNQTKTSTVLDIQRTYLARLIKELNINKFGE